MNRLFNTVSQAFTSLNVHRRRSLLSILGITIGIAAVMAVGTVSRGGNHVIYRELETFGLNSVWVFRNWNAESQVSQKRRGSGMNADDFEDIQTNKEVLGIRNATPLVRPNQRWRAANGNRSTNAQFIGVSRDYLTVVNDSVSQGRALNQYDIDNRHAVVLIGPTVVDQLIEPGSNPLTQQIRIDGKRFEVIGVLAGKSRDFLASIGSSGGEDANDRILMPYTTLQQMLGNKNIDSLQLEVSEFDNAAQVASSVSTRMQRRHPEGFRYRSETMASYIVTTNRILNGVAIIGIVSASISLLVGGMGIMNVMGTAVLERTREIGVRKAIGAREKDIQMQFLIEAALISAVGGLLGLTIGSIASIVLAKITGFPIIPSTTQVVAALLISVAVGITSGYLPARKAARLKPVQALRSE